MRVVILATGIGVTNTGVGQYARQLLPHLLPRLTSQGCEVTVLLSKDGGVSGVDSARLVRLPVPRARKNLRVLLEQIYVPFLSWSADVHVSLLSLFPLSPICAKRRFGVIQDIYHVRHLASPEEYPFDYSRSKLMYDSLAMKKTVKADGIITLSHFVAEELQKFLGLRPERIHTVYPGVDHYRFRPGADPQRLKQVRRRYRLPETFYLFVGEPSRNKNLRLILEAYASARAGREVFIPVAITSDPGRGQLFNATLKLMEETQLADTFRFLGHVPDEDLPALYAAARALLFPSLYEGFGLPPLEAMACGTPVVAANRAAIPEVVGDAALLIDPERPQTLVEALRTVNDETVRKGLIDRGFERAGRFSWESSARVMAQRILS